MTRGVRCRSLADAAVREGVATVVTPVLDALDSPDSVAVVPDVHYPYHPSTGMTTNPAVVEGVFEAVAARYPETERVLAVRSGPGIDTERTVRYLDYDDVAEAAGARLAVLDDANTESVEADAGRQAVPAPLRDAAVVLVPTARADGDLGVFGGLALAARAIDVDPSTAESVEGAREAVDPAGAVVDATYTFTARPARTRVLLGDADVRLADRALARLLRVDPDRVPGLATHEGTGSWSETRADLSVSGLDLESVAGTLPAGTPPDSTDPHPLMRAGYRAYTRVSGDIYPPQLEGDR
jgi:uncharacterized protein (DUF362 family)